MQGLSCFQGVDEVSTATRLVTGVANPRRLGDAYAVGARGASGFSATAAWRCSGDRCAYRIVVLRSLCPSQRYAIVGLTPGWNPRAREATNPSFDPSPEDVEEPPEVQRVPPGRVSPYAEHLKGPAASTGADGDIPF